MTTYKTRKYTVALVPSGSCLLNLSFFHSSPMISRVIHLVTWLSSMWLKAITYKPVMASSTYVQIFLTPWPSSLIFLPVSFCNPHRSSYKSQLLSRKSVCSRALFLDGSWISKLKRYCFNSENFNWFSTNVRIFLTLISNLSQHFPPPSPSYCVHCIC